MRKAKNIDRSSETRASSSFCKCFGLLQIYDTVNLLQAEIVIIINMSPWLACTLPGAIFMPMHALSIYLQLIDVIGLLQLTRDIVRHSIAHKCTTTYTMCHVNYKHKFTTNQLSLFVQVSFIEVFIQICSQSCIYYCTDKRQSIKARHTTYKYN